MIYRQLGKTGLEISEVSLGLEWLYKKREAEITEVLQHAIENGVNYFDIIFNFEDFLKQIKVAIKPKRDQIILMHHLGSSEYKGKYKKTRSIKKCSETYERFLQIMETDYVDILFIHFVHTLKEFEDTWAEGGVKDLALKFKEEGKARFIGMSTHLYEIAIEAAKSGVVDVIMVQLNMANHSHPKRQEFLTLCAQNNVGVIAMKPFAGGKLFQKNKTITLPKYITAGHDIGQKKITQTITSAQCIHYVLNQIGVSTLVPGAANLEELKDCLAYYDTTDEERDYSELLKDFKTYTTGECVYCNHCQPCPVDINIGLVNKLFDLANIEMTDLIRNEYNSEKTKASDCVECGDCVGRCPFDVLVIDRMKEIARLFD